MVSVLVWPPRCVPRIRFRNISRRAHESALCMKMSPLKYSTTVICAVFIAVGAASGEVVDKFGVVGGTVSFGSTSINPDVSSIVWKHRSSSGGVVKVIEWDAEDGLSIPNQRFKGFASLDQKTGQITITNLNNDHRGIYVIELNSKEQDQGFKLELMPPVPKPEIKVVPIKGDSDTVYLECPYNETITWKKSAGETLKGSKIHPKGESVTVKKRNPENFYTCTLKNPVSERTSDPVYERDLFPVSVPWWIALIVLIPVLIVAILVFLYKVVQQFHDTVDKHLKEKPCIGAILNCLDGNKKNGNKSDGTTDSNGTGLKEEDSTKPLRVNSDGDDKDDKL